MSSHFGSYVKHADTIRCPHCGKTGAIIWEDTDEDKGRHRDLIRIEGGFYERLARKTPYPIELVCNSCGTSQPSVLETEQDRKGADA